jgi:hypothetical protein
MSKVNEYVKKEVLELVKKGVDVTPSIILQLRKDFINHRNYINNKILASVDAEIYNHRKNRTKEVENINSVDLGYKNESYLSEEEMIQGYVVPTFNELSESEKEIYKTK